jgi:hypothetical protein
MEQEADNGKESLEALAWGRVLGKHRRQISGMLEVKSAKELNIC